MRCHAARGMAHRWDRQHCRRHACWGAVRRCDLASTLCVRFLSTQHERVHHLQLMGGQSSAGGDPRGALGTIRHHSLVIRPTCPLSPIMPGLLRAADCYHPFHTPHATPPHPTHAQPAVLPPPPHPPPAPVRPSRTSLPRARAWPTWRTSWARWQGFCCPRPSCRCCPPFPCCQWVRPAGRGRGRARRGASGQVGVGQAAAGGCGVPGSAAAAGRAGAVVP